MVDRACHFKWIEKIEFKARLKCLAFFLSKNLKKIEGQNPVIISFLKSV